MMAPSKEQKEICSLAFTGDFEQFRLKVSLDTRKASQCDEVRYIIFEVT